MGAKVAESASGPADQSADRAVCRLLPDHKAPSG